MTEPNIEEAQALKSFIKDRLGCGCPDEVFSKIRMEKNPVVFQGLPIDCLVKIGDRLLVAICLLEGLNGELGEDIRKSLKIGKRLRDDAGFNRFRLVVISEEADSIASVIQAQFDGLTGLDDKVHLHVLKPSAVPQFLTGFNVR